MSHECSSYITVQETTWAAMTSCKVVGRILFATDQLLGVKELAIGAGAHLIHDCRLLSSRIFFSFSNFIFFSRCSSAPTWLWVETQALSSSIWLSCCTSMPTWQRWSEGLRHGLGDPYLEYGAMLGCRLHAQLSQAKKPEKANVLVTQWKTSTCVSRGKSLIIKPLGKENAKSVCSNSTLHSPNRIRSSAEGDSTNLRAAARLPANHVLGMSNWSSRIFRWWHGCWSWESGIPPKWAQHTGQISSQQGQLKDIKLPPG